MKKRLLIMLLKVFTVFRKKKQHIFLLFIVLIDLGSLEDVERLLKNHVPVDVHDEVEAPDFFIFQTDFVFLLFYIAWNDSITTCCI